MSAPLRSLRGFTARFVASIRAFFGLTSATAADADLREELEAHLAMQIDDNLRRGMTPDEARRQALLSAGGLTVAAESTRAQRGLPLLDVVGTDVRYALRSLRNRPAFSIAVIATLALGIGANSAMFTIINAVVLRPLPYREPDRILSISQSTEGKDRSVVDELTYAAWHDAARTVTIAAYTSGDATFVTPNGAQRLKGTAVRGDYFDVFGVRPMLGRVVSPEDTRAGAPRVAVLGETVWREAFGADTSLIGRTIVSDDQPVTIIGVLPASFDDRHTQYWSGLRSANTPGAFFYYSSAVARLRDGASIDAARTELTTIARRTASDRPVPLRDFDVVVKTLHDRRFGEQRKPLLILFGAVVVLLLIACANLANLNLARAQTRQREIAVRLALGAGRWRLVRGMLCESLLLSLAGAGLGIVFARSAVRYLVRLSPSSVANADGIAINLSVLLFTLGAAVLTGVAFGLSPALTLARRDVNQVLGSVGSRTSSGPRADLVRRVLVVAQIATALLLLTGAGLVARTFWNVTSIDAGFRPAGLFVTTVQLPSRYDDARLAAFYSEMTARIRALPGVVSVALADAPPLGGARMSVSNTDSSGHRTPRTDVLAVAPGYFGTLGTRLVRGREFTDADREGSEPVAVINESLAQELFGGSDSVGAFASIGGRRRVIGVVKDVRQRELEATAAPLAYFPLAQEGLSRYEKLMVRVTGSPAVVQHAIVDVAHSVDPSLPPPTFKNASDILAEAAAPRQFTFLLLGVFAAIAGSLAVIGLYGLLSNLVADRTREIGIRLALGADARRVTRLVLAQGAALAVIGVGIGLVVSSFAVRVVQSQLFGVSARDPWTFAVSALVLVVVSVVASWLPARRAARVDPILALRAD